MGRILAIDYGIRRTGIAVTDAQRIIATPLTTIEPANLVGFIKEFALEHEIDQIVVGYPLKEDGSPTDLTSKVDSVIQHLKSTFPDMEVNKHDERYTSKMAKESMIQSGSKKKARRTKSNIDQISATLILQSFMEENRIAQ
jgi:putative Holliday junction resolvase